MSSQAPSTGNAAPETSSPKTVTAVRIHRFGGPEALQVEQIAMPGPKDDEVLLRVGAASVNPVDYKIRAGKAPYLKEDQLPAVLGRDVAGTIEACGTRAHYMMRKGDRLFAMLGFDRGAYADHVIVKAAEMVAMPEKLDFPAAAAVPLAGLTAWQGLFRHGGLQRGQRVLIHGGSGGVGHLAVQFAKAKGAHVLTTARGEDADFLREIGADEVIDYKNQRFEEIATDIDLVLDLVAGETQDRSWAVLKRGGIIVSTLAEPDQDRAEAEGKRGTHFLAEVDAGQLQEIADLIEAGRVAPHVARTFPLEEARAAQEALEHEHVRGKIVLTVD
ncbi:NADP-dependent oxidoreductase [Stakelama saccharophila]|uniref:NADP-dependent oxidoreductase n=1 Tax=Stakelama saccharophila TaxID=3075605 RepID=A0ABZ0BAV6_9SPHN|nr:NADP-dependent oxidoreductase [Stakelama sp. W311]WNO53816.1 NADP-dependent oxidoreductase [Stakelama sp. W311]